MKTINYTGSSKLISRIVNLLNRKVPLPLDGDGNPDWGTNGQVLSTNGVDGATWVNQGGGGSGGHTIEDADGTAMTQRAGLQFVGATVTDDSVDDRTVVTIPQGTTYTEGDGIDISAQNEISVDTTFTEASTRANIASGDTFATILGKIKKYFTDLATVSFSGKSSDLNNDAGFITSSGSITGSSGSCTGNAATATKATQDADGKDIRMKYVNIYNSTDVGNSSTVTVNDLALQGTATGMIYAATDNPKGSSGWVHVWSQAWKKGVNTSWVSQLAMDVSGGSGVYYRTNQGTAIGRAWTRLIDKKQLQVKNSKTVLYAHTQAHENKDITYTMTADGYVQILGQQQYYVWSGFEIYVNGVNMYAVFQQGNSTPNDIDKLFLYTVHVFKGDTVRFRVVDAHADLNFFSS